MDVFIYFFEELDYGLDEIEDAIEEALEGRGEVTGMGIGISGGNIDIEIFDNDMMKSSVLKIVRNVLMDFNIPSSTLMKIDGEEYSI